MAEHEQGAAPHTPETDVAPPAAATPPDTPDTDTARTGGAAAEPRQGLLVDWGGVMTNNLFASFAAFCEAEGLDPQALAVAFRGNDAARDMLIGFEEGRVAEQEFEDGLGSLLGLAQPKGLIDKLFAGATVESLMVDAVRSARRLGVKTGLISNSWGTSRYPRDLLSDLFDGIVISGEVGIRKPTRRIYELGAESIGLPPRVCVFVDDLPFNLPPAEDLGMAAVHHVDPQETVAALEGLLRLSLREAPPSSRA